MSAGAGIVARYGGSCPRCGSGWKAGDTIRAGSTDVVTGDYPMVREGVLSVYEPRTRRVHSWPLTSIRNYRQDEA